MATFASDLLFGNMRIVNLNPDTDIGASAWFVDIEGHRLLMDAGIHPKRQRGQTITFHLLALFGFDSFASRLPAKYNRLFRLFQLPMCNRWAICRIVKVVSRLSRPAIANFSG